MDSVAPHRGDAGVPCILKGLGSGRKDLEMEFEERGESIGDGAELEGAVTRLSRGTGTAIIFFREPPGYETPSRLTPGVNPRRTPKSLDRSSVTRLPRFRSVLY